MIKKKQSEVLGISDMTVFKLFIMDIPQNLI